MSWPTSRCAFCRWKRDAEASRRNRKPFPGRASRVSSEITRPGFAYFHGRPFGGGTYCSEFDGFVARGAIDEKESADHFAGFGEWAVAQAAFAAADLQALAFGIVAQ